MPIVTAQPLPPSEHILTYEKFISGNAYAGDYVSIYAKIEEIDRDTDLNNYRIALVPPNGVKDRTETRRVVVSVENPCDIKIKNQCFFTVDKEIGIPLLEGDNVVVIGMAGKFVGITREITLEDGGTIILLLETEEYDNRKEMIHSSANAREISNEITAIGSFNLNLLDNNVELLNGLVSALPPTSTPTGAITHDNKETTTSESEGTSSILESIIKLIESFIANTHNSSANVHQFERTSIEDVVKNPAVYMDRNVSVKGMLCPRNPLIPNADWVLTDEQNYGIYLVPKLPYENHRLYSDFEVYQVNGKVTLFNGNLALKPYEMEKIVSESQSLRDQFKNFWFL